MKDANRIFYPEMFTLGYVMLSVQPAKGDFLYVSRDMGRVTSLSSVF